MTTNAKYVFEGESSSMERAYKTGNKLVEDLIRTVASMTPAYTAADKAADELVKRNRDLERAGARLRESLISPQQEYAAAVRQATQLLNAEEISESQYALAVEQANAALEAKDGTLKKTQADAAKLAATQKEMTDQGARLRASLVTPQQEYAEAVQLATRLLNAEEISEGQYALAVQDAQAALEAKDGTLKKTQADAARLVATQKEMADQGARIRASLVTPQSEYAEKIRIATQALNAEEISEAEYAMAVENAKKALDEKDDALQDTLRSASRIRQNAITPEQQHAEAIKSAKNLLKEKLITQREYDLELRNQNDLLKKAQSAQDDFGASTSSSLGQMASALGGVGASIGAITGSAQLLKTEYENLLESQKTAADKQLDTAGSQRAAMFSLGDDPAMSPAQLNTRAFDIARKNGVSLKKTFDALGNALSSKSALSSEDAVSATDVALEANPHEGAMEIAGSLLDMKNRFGGTHRGMMGLNLGTQQASRVKDASSFAKNVVPTIVQLGGFGDTAREASILVASLSTAMNDLEGRSSATAAEQLAKQLAENLPAAKTGLTTTTERLKFLQSDAGKKKREEFLGDGKGKKGSFSFESGAYIAMHEIVNSGQNKTKEAYDAAAIAIPQIQDAETYYAKALERVNSQALQVQSALDRQLKVAEEFGSLHNIEGGKTAISRQGIDKALQQSGASWTERFSTARAFDYNVALAGTEQPDEFAARTLTERANKLRTPTVYTQSDQPTVTIPPTAQALADADTLMKVADEIRRLNVNMEKNNGNLEQNTKATEQNTNKPAPSNKRPTNATPKTPASSALASSGGK